MGAGHRLLTNRPTDQWMVLAGAEAAAPESGAGCGDSVERLLEDFLAISTV